MSKEEISLGTASLSKNCQTYIISKARPYFPDLKPGDSIEFVFDIKNGKVYIRKSGRVVA